MRVTYIHHSGFAIEYDDGTTLIFDFFKDVDNILPTILGRSKQVYVFVSHSHPDHYNHRIFNWTDKYTNATFSYIISHELYKKITRQNKIILTEHIHALHRNESFADEHISVRAFGSTDIGVSYLVNADNKSIFHAGDLNNWHWSDESTPEEIKAAEGNYLAIVRDIKSFTPFIYLVLFPVDPRIGGDFSRGARQFVNGINVEHFIPMHQWGDYAQSCQFDLYKAATGHYHCLHDGESIDL